jgi:hypothetical protein
LNKSGLTPEDLRRFGVGVWSLTPTDLEGFLKAVGFGWALQCARSGYVLQYPLNGYYRVKVFWAEACQHREKHPKYLGPAGRPTPAFVTESVQALASKCMQAVAVVEGEKKTLALLKAGVNAVGLGGCWNFRNPDGGLVEPLNDWDFRDRLVYLIPDADWRTNADVVQAWTTLGLLLACKGAACYVVTWDPKYGKGADDAIVNGLDIQAAIQEARPLTEWIAANAPRFRNAILSALGSVDLPADLMDGFIRAVAKSLGVSHKAVRVEVKRRREAKAEAAMENPIPENLVEPPPGPELLQGVEALLNRFIVLPPGGSLLISTWTIAAWLYDIFDLLPLLIITSPTKRCGKSNLLTLLREIVPRPCPTLNVSEAALFRTAEKERPTFLFDEAHYLLGAGRTGERAEAIRQLLCGGFRRDDPPVRRLEKSGDGFKDVAFNVYCPKAVALIGHVDDQLADRALIVRLERKSPSDRVERFLVRRVKAAAEPVRQAILAWAKAFRNAVQEAYESIEPIEGIDDREADKFAVLQAVLQVLDPSRTPELIAFARQNAGAAEKQDQDAQLLAAVRRAFDEAEKTRPDDFLATTAILQALAEDFTWAAVRQDDHAGVTRASKTLADKLARYGVRPRRVWMGGRVVRGYLRRDLEGVWRKYITPSDLSEASDPSECRAEAESNMTGQTPLTGPGGTDLSDPGDFLLGREDPNFRQEPVRPKEPVRPEPASQADSDASDASDGSVRDRKQKPCQVPLIPQKAREGSKTVRGYYRRDLEGVWQKYVPDTPDDPPDSPDSPGCSLDTPGDTPDPGDFLGWEGPGDSIRHGHARPGGHAMPETATEADSGESGVSAVSTGGPTQIPLIRDLGVGRVESKTPAKPPGPADPDPRDLQDGPKPEPTRLNSESLQDGLSDATEGSGTAEPTCQTPATSCRNSSDPRNPSGRNRLPRRVLTGLTPLTPLTGTESKNSARSPSSKSAGSSEAGGPREIRPESFFCMDCWERDVVKIGYIIGPDGVRRCEACDVFAVVDPLG